MKYISIVTAFLLLGFSSLAQQQLGLRLENYAGASSLSLNPTGHLSNPLRWDLNLVGAGAFFENNYAYLRSTNTLDLLRHRNSAEFVLAADLEGPTGDGVFVVDFFDNSRKRFGHYQTYVEGPALALQLGESHAVGIFANLRGAGGSQNIPNQYSYYHYDGWPLQNAFEVGKLQAAFMNWSEIGLNYAYKMPTDLGFMGFGANLKFLQGWEAGYIESLEPFDHTKLPNNTISISAPHSRFGYARSDAPISERNGSGLAFDLGFTAVWDEHDNGHRLKIGASLLDIGYLRFDKNAQAHRVSPDASITLALDDYEGYSSIDDVDGIIRQFSQQALGDSAASRVDDAFRLSTPAALSLQGDLGLTEFLYVDALLVQRLPTAHPAPQRGNLFAVTPRFQNRWFALSLPISLYNWQDLRLGLAARLGFLVIGTDHLGAWVGNGDYTGADFYFAVKVNPFQIGAGQGAGGGDRRRYGKGGRVKCYEF